MSLADAVTEIADQMEEEAADVKNEGPHGSFLCNSLRGWARQLRTALKASEGAAPPAPVQNPLLPAPLQHFAAIEEERRKIREARRKEAVSGDLEGAFEEKLVAIAGTDKEDGVETMIRIPNNMPVGARCPIEGKWFKLKEDNKLHYDEASTQEASGVKGGIIEGRA